MKKKKKYELESRNIFEYVGTNSNYSKIFNCITRLRFKIINNEKVQIDAIKKMEIVKGVVWNGQELQIIIGSDVEKVKVAVESLSSDVGDQLKLKSNQQAALPICKKLLNFIVAVVVPCLPLMFYTGLSSGISALLSQPGIGLTQSGWAAERLSDLDVFSAFLFLNERVGFMLLGVFFGYNTAKYMNSDLILSLLICLTLSSGLLIKQEWIIIKNIFNTGENISIRGYDNSILIFIFSIIGFSYLLTWVKSWMPSMFSSMFTPLITVGITLNLAFFVIGPFVSIIEKSLAVGVLYLLDIPFGIGALIVALLFQPLVLTGSHLALSSIVLSSMNNLHEPSVYYVCVQISAFAQAGAVLGCAIMGKERAFKFSSFATFPITGIFGITEPALYAINLPKVKPFIGGCVASGFTGLIAGILGLKMQSYTGNGIFGMLGFAKLSDGFIFLGLGILAIVLSTIITCLIYAERPNELKAYKKFFKINKVSIGDKELQQIESFYQNAKILEKEILNIQKINASILKTKKENTKIETDLKVLEIKRVKQNYFEHLKAKEILLKNIESISVLNQNKKIKETTKNNLSSLDNNYDTFLVKYIK